MGISTHESARVAPSIIFVFFPQGNVPGGLLVHPDAKHLIYPLGNTIVIESLDDTHKQKFLSGHTNNVSCVTVSKSGRFVASGQVTHMGFKADVIVWDFESKSLYCRLVLHKVKVEALAFSPNDKFLTTLGGQDDGRYVIVKSNMVSLKRGWNV